MKENILIDGKEYVLKDSIKTQQKAVSKKGMEFCIVRTYSAGVWAGYINRKLNKPENVVYEAIRLWQWFGATLSQVANDGFIEPSKCKIPDSVVEVSLTNIIEVIPCSKKSQESIISIKRWQQ